MRDRPDPLRAGPQLYLWRTGDRPGDENLNGPLVVFIHGFAASGAQLQRLASHVDSSFTVAMFDYTSYKGIDRGADDLSQLLARFSPVLAATGLALVGHSMGGLVAKQFARHADLALRRTLRGIATLCSPHGAAMPARAPHVRRRLLAMMLDLVEKDELPDPFARSLFCPAARQLLGEDPLHLIASLLEADDADPLDIPVLTMSGGRNYIELFQPGSPLNRVANGLIQANLTRPNDGLVEESSADLTRCAAKPPRRARHRNDYIAWSDTNHTYVVENQDVGYLLVDWLKEEAFH